MKAQAFYRYATLSLLCIAIGLAPLSVRLMIGALATGYALQTIVHWIYDKWVFPVRLHDALTKPICAEKLADFVALIRAAAKSRSLNDAEQLVVASALVSTICLESGVPIEQATDRINRVHGTIGDK